MEDVNKRQKKFLFLSKLECGPQEINSREIRLHLTKFEKNSNSFQSDVFVAAAVVDAKTP